jgi:hypothetical protein
MDSIYYGILYGHFAKDKCFQRTYFTMFMPRGQFFRFKIYDYYKNVSCFILAKVSFLPCAFVLFDFSCVTHVEK